LYDLKRGEIPDWISLGLVVAALAAAALGLHGAGWTGLLLGAGVAFVLGIALFAMEGLGGGDVKLVTAIGAALGPTELVHVLFWIALAGGATAILAAVRGMKAFAYAPAIAAGLAVYALYPFAWKMLSG
jgi:prepilin peptidase CpaA